MLRLCTSSGDFELGAGLKNAAQLLCRGVCGFLPGLGDWKGGGGRREGGGSLGIFVSFLCWAFSVLLLFWLLGGGMGGCCLCLQCSAAVFSALLGLLGFSINYWGFAPNKKVC